MIRLREPRPAEPALFAAWERAERPYPWNEAHFLSSVDSRVEKLLVLESGGVACGFAAVHLLGDDAHLLNLMVDPARRRQGLGGRLLSDLLGWFREKGARRVTLDVDPGNRAAVALYGGAGFELLERRPRSYPGGEDALVMRKTL